MAEQEKEAGRRKMTILGWRICDECGKKFLQVTPDQHFCSRACHVAFYRYKGKHHDEAAPGEEVLHSFECRTCGKQVNVVDKTDRRTVFCTQACEKKWWRDVTRHENAAQKRGRGGQGLSGALSLSGLKRREALDLS